jgi:hypothetical protein
VCVSATYALTSVHIVGVQHVLATSQDPERLLNTWTEYQRRFNSKIDEYLEILHLTKVAAEANGENLLRYYIFTTSCLI